MAGLLCFDVSAAEEGSMELVFSDNFESYEVGSALSSNTGDFSKWTSVAKSTASPVVVNEEDGNKFLSLGRAADQTEAAGPRVSKLLPVGVDSKICVKVKVQTNGQTFQLTLRSADNSAATTLFNLSGDDVLSRTPGGMKLKSDSFEEFMVEINCFTMKYTSYINGKVYKRNQAVNGEISIDEGINIRFGTSIQPGKEVYIDDVEIYSDDPGLAEGKLVDVLSLKTDSNVLLTPYVKESHPKIYVSDFDDIREKVANDDLAAKWYATVKSNADSLLLAEPEPYAPESDILTNTQRRIRNKLYTLAFVYAMEGDSAYKERALLEIRNADEYPSWHPNNFLGVAELSGGIAVAYDWMYDGMTEEEREYVKGLLVNKSLYLGALSYEGISDVFFVTADSNWNFVCNGGMVLCALAISGEYPQLADYIFNNAAESIPYATEITFAPQGASPEGPGYWDYAASNFMNMIAAIDSATDGKKIPEKFNFVNTTGISTTLDFPVATHSSVGRFNYGDNVPAYGQGSPDLPISFWAAEKYNRPDYAKFQIQSLDLKGSYGSPWEIVLKLMWYNPSLIAESDAEFPLDKFYVHDNGPNLVTVRSAWEDEIYFGMQGGLNGASHSFLSLGTFIVDALGERWATQIGQGNYRWDGYFEMAGKRWTYYNCHTEGQNCVVLNPDEGPQQNITALAKTIDHYSSTDESYGVLDLSEAYDKSVVKYHRGAKLFDKKTKLVVQDDIVAKEPVKNGYWFMHTDAKVFIDDDGKAALLVKNGKKMHLQIVSDFESAKFTYMDAKPLPTSQNPEIQQAEDYGKKLAIDLTGAENIKLAVVFTPLADGRTVTEGTFTLTSIQEWADVKTEKTDNNADILYDVIALYEGSSVAYKKGETVSIDSTNSNIVPVVKDGRTMVPLRFVAETLGAQVEWNNKENTVYIKNNLDELKFVIGEKSFYKNGIKFDADTSAYVYEGRTFVPVRTVAEAFGKNVGWKNGLVTISKFKDVENNTDVANQITDKLVYRLSVSGKEISFFDIDNSVCEVYVSPLDAKNREIVFESFKKDDIITVVQPDANGIGSVTVNGKKIDVKLYSDPYFYASGDYGIKSIEVKDADFKDMTGVVTWLKPVSVTATIEGAGAVGGICDNNIDTFWSAQGVANVGYDLGSVRRVTSMSLANDYKTGTRRYIFDLQYSKDGVNWKNLLTDAITSGETPYLEMYDFDDVDARYIRFVAKGNTSNNWNIFYELRLYESAEQQESDRTNWNDYFAKVNWSGFVVGDTMRISVVADLNNGIDYVFGDSDIVSCISDNEDVVKLNGNVIEAVGKGTAKITLTVNYHGIYETVEIDVKVTE